MKNGETVTRLRSRPVAPAVGFLLPCMTWSGQKVGYVSWRRKEACGGRSLWEEKKALARQAP